MNLAPEGPTPVGSGLGAHEDDSGRPDRRRAVNKVYHRVAYGLQGRLNRVAVYGWLDLSKYVFDGPG